jgi:rare lipoprotein A
MRTILMSLLAALTVGLFGTTAATAAGKWTCDGPEYVCGSATNSVTTTRSPDAAERSSPRANKVAKAAKPAKARNTEVAARSSDEDRPARRATRQARATSQSDNSGYTLSGKASYYWQPQALASGGRFNPDAYTAAHKTLPFGTRVRVTNQNNGQSVTVVINDRGPYIAGRIIDLSRAAAGAINMKDKGVVPVSVQVLGRG